MFFRNDFPQFIALETINLHIPNNLVMRCVVPQQHFKLLF